MKCIECGRQLINTPPGGGAIGPKCARKLGLTRSVVPPRSQADLLLQLDARSDLIKAACALYDAAGDAPVFALLPNPVRIAFTRLRVAVGKYRLEHDMPMVVKQTEDTNVLPSLWPA